MVRGYLFSSKTILVADFFDELLILSLSVGIKKKSDFTFFTQIFYINGFAQILMV